MDLEALPGNKDTGWGSRCLEGNFGERKGGHFLHFHEILLGNTLSLPPKLLIKHPFLVNSSSAIGCVQENGARSS